MILCTLEGIFFVFYAGGFFLDQISGINYNQTYIEYVQKKKGVFQDRFKNFEDVFGRNYWFWMLPVKPDIKVNYYEEIMVTDGFIGDEQMIEEEGEMDNEVLGMKKIQ